MPLHPVCHTGDWTSSKILRNIIKSILQHICLWLDISPTKFYGWWPSSTQKMDFEQRPYTGASDQLATKVPTRYLGLSIVPSALKCFLGAALCSWVTDEGPVRLKYFMAFYRPFSPYLRWVTQVECVLEVGINACLWSQGGRDWRSGLRTSFSYLGSFRLVWCSEIIWELSFE